MIDLARNDLEQWYTALAARVAPSTQAGELSGVRAFYKWAFISGLRDDDPSATLPRPSVPAGTPRPIDTADLTMAVGLASGRIYNALILAAYTGMRAAEIAAARRDWLHSGMITITGKGNRQRLVPAHHLVVPVFNNAQPYVFPRLDGRPGPSAPWVVSQECNRYLAGLGIDDTLHSLRHWFATNLYQATTDIRLTQDMLGHASPTTTAVYARWCHDGPTVELLPAVA